MKHLPSFIFSISLWFRLWTKRLFFHPFFLFTLFLLPAVTFFIQASEFSKDAILRIALCIDGKDPDSVAERFQKELSGLSDRTVEFYFVPEKDMVYSDVAEQKAVSGYILSADLKKNIEAYTNEQKPFITTVQQDGEMSNKLINEILLSKLYRTHAFMLLRNFLSKKSENIDLSFIQERFRSYQRQELLFRFEYADGTENKLLQQSTGLLLMPLRGIISVLVFLSCMTGAITWYEDAQTGFSQTIPETKKKLCLFFSLFIPAFYAGILGIISLSMTDISEKFIHECTSMGGFLFACISLGYFLLSIIKRKEIFFSFLPLLLIGALILCPVFIDLSIYSPALRFMRCLFPTHYYLSSLHDHMALFHMLLYGLFFLLCGKAIQKFH